jgi:hypothetical protein
MALHVEEVSKPESIKYARVLWDSDLRKATLAMFRKNEKKK